MARKVFISILGTSIYNTCRYKYQEQISSNTVFVQQAIMELLQVCAWKERDTAIFLLTEQAKKSNWNKSITARVRGGESVPYRGLASVIEDMRLSCTIDPLNIPNGNDEYEIWEIFQLLFERMRDGDEVYIDLTHSFRYIPMLVLILSNYAKFLKKITLRSITYGNFEARDRVTNIAPVIDLLPIATLQDWTFAAGQFMNGGDTQAIHQLCRDRTKAIFMQSDVPDEAAIKLSTFSKELKKVIDERVFCRGNEIVSSVSIRSFKAATERLGKSIIPPLNPLISKISGSLNAIEPENDPKNLFWAAKWCCDNNYFQQAVTILQEGVISSFCSRMNWDLNDVTSRNSVGAAFFHADTSHPLTYEEVTQGDKAQVELLIKAHGDLLRSYAHAYSELSCLRNAFNHSGMGLEKNRRAAATLMKNTRQWLDKFEPLFDGKVVEPTKSERIFVNFSNHPSSIWSEAQKRAASDYGELVDLPFPAIAPEEDRDYIEELAAEYFEKVTDIADPASAVVHIMGELSFTFSLIGKLKAAGYKCIASTTSRMVTTDEKGNKVASFGFVRFREY